MEPSSPTFEKLRTHYFREEEYDYAQMGADWTFNLAKTGKRQSPIDIPFDAKNESDLYENESELKDFEVILAPTVLDTQIVTEHLNLTIPVPEGGLRIIMSDHDNKRVEYQALQYYFHCQSEHTLNGKRFDAEFKLITRIANADKSTKNTRAQFSVLLTTDKKVGARGLDKLFDPFAKYPKPFKAPVEEIATFLAMHARFFTYKGSGTIPPCSENVTWYILTQPAYVSPENLKILQDLFSNSEFYSKIGNTRMTQPLNDREVRVVKSKAFDEDDALSNLPDLTFNEARLRSFSVDENFKISKLTVEYQETYGWDFTQQGDDWIGTDHCKSCERQSPIMIPYDFLSRNEAYPNEKIIKLLNITITDPKFVSVIAKAHLNFRIPLPYGLASIEIESASGKTKHYAIQELHFHANSEHTFKSKKLDAELHVVTRQVNKKDSRKETRAVFGILLTRDEQIGAKGLEGIYEPIHLYPSSFVNPIAQVAEFISKNARFFTYKGSLTTPPCSENVNWHVLTTPAYGKKEDIRALQKIYQDQSLFSEHGSARRVQPLNGREVKIIRSKDF